MRKLLERRREPFAELTHPRQQTGLVGELQRGERGGTDDGSAGEGRAVVAGGEDVGEALAGDEGADRQAAAERLGGSDGVGYDAGLLVGPERAGAAHAALDLVEDECGAVLVAGFARGAQQLFGEDVHAGLALDRLKQDGGGALIDSRT